MKHEKRRFVEKVDFVTSPGFLRGDNSRAEGGLPAGGMMRVVTDLALFGFDGKSRRMKMMALNPGVTREQVQDNTGFALLFADDMGVTAPPTDQELKVLRELDPDQFFTA
jgi:glutaconate CoA-transferase subunit B